MVDPAAELSPGFTEIIPAEPSALSPVEISTEPVMTEAAPVVARTSPEEEEIRVLVVPDMLMLPAVSTPSPVESDTEPPVEAEPA